MEDTMAAISLATLGVAMEENSGVKALADLPDWLDEFRAEVGIEDDEVWASFTWCVRRSGGVA